MGAGRRLPILTYHALGDDRSALSIPAGVFAEHMRFLHETGARPLTLPAAVDALRTGSLPARAVVITFDDGYASVHRHAFPVLRRYGFAATVFVVTASCDRDGGGSRRADWSGGRAGLRWDDVREMASAGFAFGAHTMTHPDLTRLPLDAAMAEIRGSKEALERELGRPAEAFAYPYGVYNDRVRALVSSHFALACSTRLDFARPASDVLGLERLDVHYLRRPRVFRRLWDPAMLAYVGVRRALRELRARTRAARREVEARA